MRVSAVDKVRYRIEGGGATPMRRTIQEIDQLSRLLDQARGQLDGSHASSEDEAEAFEKLLIILNEAVTAAKQRCAEERQPFDQAAQAITGRYQPLLARAALATDACQQALSPWARAAELHSRQAAEDARQQAAAKSVCAEDAKRSVHPADLAARETANALAQEAARLDEVARDAEQAHLDALRRLPATLPQPPVLADRRSAMRHYWRCRAAVIDQLLCTLAFEDACKGSTIIPGFAIAAPAVEPPTQRTTRRARRPRHSEPTPAAAEKIALAKAGRRRARSASRAHAPPRSRAP